MMRFQAGRRAIFLLRRQFGLHSKHRGQILVMFALAMIVILGFAALAVDTGFLLAERRGVQNAADASAMAAARHIARGNDEGSAVTVGHAYAGSNGYSAGGGTTVTVTPNGDVVEVVVEHEVERFFLDALYTGDWSVSARAVAETVPLSGPFAIIALGEDPNCHPSTGVRFSGTNDINVETGSIASNSCVRVDGNSLDALIDGDVRAMYGMNDSHDRLQVTPGHIKDGQSNRITDPFAHLVDPTCAADGEVLDDPHYSGSGQGKIMTPGRYRNSNLNLPGNTRQISLLPGVYCLETQLRIGSQVLARSVDANYESDGEVGDGGGVLLYATTNSGEIRFNGQGSAQFRSLGFLNPEFEGCTNACEENLVVWISEEVCTDWDSTGGSNTVLHGVIYAPCSSVELGGNAGSDALTGMIVADTVRLHGNVTLNLVADEDRLTPIPTVLLVE